MAFFCADFFLATHCGNYFAKNLLPRSSALVASSLGQGGDASRICLACWCKRGTLYKEDETLSALSGNTEPHNKLQALLGSHCDADWVAFGRFLGRMRQKRRHARGIFGNESLRLEQISYQNCKPRWRRQGGYVCRHGLFFLSIAPRECHCIVNRTASTPNWQGVVRMPVLNRQLKSSVVAPFDVETFRTIQSLLAEVRRLQW